MCSIRLLTGLVGMLLPSTYHPRLAADLIRHFPKNQVSFKICVRQQKWACEAKCRSWRPEGRRPTHAEGGSGHPSGKALASIQLVTRRLGQGEPAPRTKPRTQPQSPRSLTQRRAYRETSLACFGPLDLRALVKARARGGRTRRYVVHHITAFMWRRWLCGVQSNPKGKQGDWGTERHITKSGYKERKKAIKDSSSRQGFFTSSSSTSQLANALAFISRSTSA